MSASRHPTLARESSGGDPFGGSVQGGLTDAEDTEWALIHVSRPQPAGRAALLWLIPGAIGAVAFLVGLGVAPQRAWASLHLSSQYLVGLGLGGLYLIACYYLTSASWGVVVRRFHEAQAILIAVGLVGVGLVLILRPSLFPWTSPDPAIEGFKRDWLNYPFMLGRSAVYAACWVVFGHLLIRESRAQDHDGDARHAKRNIALSAGFMVVFALTCWLSSVDWLMSLDPLWYSTIFGVYNYAGIFSSGVAAAILLAQWARRRSAVRALVRDDHMQDLGKLLLTATTLWVYMWFCQYMLIWYANIPEETARFVVRREGAWRSLFLINPVINWAIPFLLLLPRATKRHGVFLAGIAVVVLLGRWIDLYLMIYPSVFRGDPLFGVWEVGVSLGALGVAASASLWALGRAPIVPLRDPRLAEGLALHQ